MILRYRKYRKLLRALLRWQRKAVTVDKAPAEIKITVGEVTGEYGVPDDE